MATVVGLRRAGWAALFFVLVGLTAGCGSDGEVSAPSPDPSTTTVVEAVSGVDEYGVIDTSAITAAFLPEITEYDIEIIEGEAGTSYRYVFPVQDISDGVSFELEARWDPIDGGLQPSLEWNLTGSEISPSDFAFVASVPKSFAETVDDIAFDPQPDEIIERDPVVEWDFDATRPVTISAISDFLLSWNRAGGDASDVPTIILNALNDHRIHRELSACARLVPNRSMLTPDVSPAGLMIPCYLKVVAVNASTFGGESCAHLGAMIGTWGDSPAFQFACQSVVQFATGGSAAAGCDRASTPSQREACLSVMWGLLAGDCPAGDPVEQQICVYEAAVAVGDDQRCDYVAHLGSPEMADDCRAAITKDPSYCGEAEDPELRASCCENFRGTDDYDTCLASVAEAPAGESTSTTTDEETTTTAAGDSTTTEPTEEDPPPAIPAGSYTGSFDEALLIDLLSYDFGKPDTNTITVTVDEEGLIGGDMAVHQEGVFLGCAGAVDDWIGTVDSGQSVGSELPQSVTVTMQTSGFESFEAEGFGAGAAHCLVPPRPYSDGGSMGLSFDRIADGLLAGKADDYMPFELRLVP